MAVSLSAVPPDVSESLLLLLHGREPGPEGSSSSSVRVKVLPLRQGKVLEDSRLFLRDWVRHGVKVVSFLFLSVSDPSGALSRLPLQRILQIPKRSPYESPHRPCVLTDRIGGQPGRNP